MLNAAKIPAGFWPLLGLATIFGPASASLAQGPQLRALDTLTPGNWELRNRENDTRHQICVRNGRELIQLRHGQSGCQRLIVEDGADRVTVQYTCQGHGYGRTQIRRETPVIAQIDSQGVVDGKPFQFSAEARRIGGC